MSEVNGKSFHRHLMASGVSSFSKCLEKRGVLERSPMLAVRELVAVQGAELPLNKFSPQ